MPNPKVWAGTELMLKNSINKIIEFMPFSVAITKLLSAVDSVNAASFATNLSALQLLLKDPKNSIRFFIYSSSGMGHQSTAANIIYRLISLGLTGSYQVIYINAFDALKKNCSSFSSV
ncbi:hypothetical protein QQ054_35930 [Oscillatoria amoena NRMC-F 0135]|nr:hypothetical protein [Oscillatoria amoena NRMC-F 0135]